MHYKRVVLDSLRLIDRAVRLSSKSSELTLGISAAQLFVLQKLAETDGLSINELARETQTHQSSVSVVVSKLAARRLVRRSVSPRDKRRITISLSAKGRGALVGAPESVQARLLTALDEFSAAELKKLGTLLVRWTRCAGIAAAAPPLFGEETR